MKMLTPKEIAEILQISYDSALAFIKFSGIDYIQIGRQYRVDEQKFKTFLAKRGTVVIPLAENVED